MIDHQRNAKRSDQEWVELIQECRTSGLGDKDWCEQHGIPISSFYTKVSRLRRKACEIPKAQRHVIRETQQVVPLQIVDDMPAPYVNQLPSAVVQETPAVVLRIQDYSIEITNHAARETILFLPSRYLLTVSLASASR